MNESVFPLFPSNCRLEDHAFYLAMAPFIQSVWITSALVCHYRYGGDTSRDYPAVRKGPEYFDNQFHCCMQYGCVSMLPKAFQNYMTSLINDVVCQVHFNVSLEQEIYKFLQSELSKRKIVIWARQCSSELPAEMLKKPMIQSVLIDDIDAFFCEILKREKLLKKCHYWRMFLVRCYQTVADRVGQLADWIYWLRN